MSFVQNLFVNNNLEVGGNLQVNGTTTSIDSVNINVKDRHIYLNNDYTTTSGKTGGLVLNYLPTSTTDTVAGIGFDTTITVGTTGTDTFSAGNIIQISDASDSANNGIFEVLTHSSNLITIAASDFAQSTFVADSTTGANITLINVTILQSSVTGVWQTTSGSNSADLTTNLKDILLGGSAITNTNLTLTDNANQLTFDHSETGGTDFATILNVVEPAQASTYTVPDVGATANFIMSTGAQDISGIKTFKVPIILDHDEFTSNDIRFSEEEVTNFTIQHASDTILKLTDNNDNKEVWSITSDGGGGFPDHNLMADVIIDRPVTLLATSSQMVLGTTNTTTISAKAPSSSAVYTIPDVGTIADFLFTAGAQTISGTKIFDPNSATGGAFVVSNTSTQTSGNLVAITGDTGETALNVTVGNVIIADDLTVNGVLTADNVIDAVKAYSGAGPHVLATDGKSVNEVTHTTAATVTLPTTPTQGTKYTIINFLTADNNLTVNSGGSDTIDDGVLTTIILPQKYQRFTLQYVGVNWYIV